MIILFGTRTYLRALGIVTLVCGRCGNPAAHRLEQRIRKFTLFFVPLFPISTHRSATCTFCGQTTSLTEQQTDSYLAVARQQAQPTASLQVPQPPPQ